MIGSSLVPFNEIIRESKTVDEKVKYFNSLLVVLLCMIFLYGLSDC